MKKLKYYNCMLNKLETIKFFTEKYPRDTLYFYKEPKRMDDYIPIRLRDEYLNSRYNLVICSVELYGPMFTVQGYVDKNSHNVYYDLWDFIEWE